MSAMPMETRDKATTELAARYEQDGFVFPIEAVSREDAERIRGDLESAEAELAQDPTRLGLLRSYPDRLLPSFDRLIRGRALIEAVRPILGDDLLVWSAALFIKEPNTPHIVSWHQDLTYWGLNDAEEVTAWVALSPSNETSGCMRFVPGSHKKRLVPHVDTFSDNNLLSRGQEIAVDVKEGDGVSVILEPGQASLHHGHLFHSSGPNQTSDRRIGAAVRFIKPSMKQTTGDKSLVTLVSGEDHHNNFKVVGSPRGRLTEGDFEHCLADAEIKRKVLYEGADVPKGKRY